jgi:hypothetical protein
MKKIITALLLMGIVLSVASCGRNKDKNSSTSSSSSQTTQGTTNSGNGCMTENMGAKSFLHSVYGTFLTNMIPVYEAGSADEVKGYFAGPETETVTEKDEETGEEYSYEVPKNEPGEVSVSEGDELESQTLFPASSADKLSGAAVFFNLMNQNNGTFAAFEVKNESDIQGLADMMKNKVKNNQWICGFPERYLIMRVGNIMIFSYGLDSSLSAFKGAVTVMHTNAAVLYDELL